MSYCRWSTDDYQCDVYAYADVNGGISVHVAASRYVFNEPLPDKVSWEDVPAFVAREKKLMQMIDKAHMEPIGLEYDGQCFFNLSQEDAAALIDKLTALGYRVPSYVAQDIWEDEVE